MTKSDGSSKGFSLFTPLVGTAIVLMATLIATGMIQNDIRLSRTITASYEISSQSTVAKMIKATAEVQMLENMENSLYSLLATEREFDIVCDSESACISEADKRFNESNYGFMAAMTTGPNGLYAGVISSIKTVTDYSTNVDDNVFYAALNRMAVDHKSTVSVKFINGYLKATIDTDTIKEYVGSALDVPFRDASGNSIIVSVVPEEFSYTSKEPVQEMVVMTARAFKSSWSESTLRSSLQNAGPYLTSYGSGRAEWTLEGGKKFIIKFSS